jgi:hypothetical protein
MNSVVSSNLDATGCKCNGVHGDFIDMQGDRFYVIRNVQNMAPFFVSLVSADDHWLFASSTGGLTAGRVSPDTAIFPYDTVDKLHLSINDTGPKTIIRVRDAGETLCWEPFNTEHQKRFAMRRNLYKNTLGNKLCFEEVNEELGLAFRYTWSTSEEFGFVRDCELHDVGAGCAEVDILDGVQNVLPAGTPRFTQTNSSNLVNAYKWAEIDEDTGLAFLSLYSGISDRAEPCESLKATTAFCLGAEDSRYLVSSSQLDAFRSGADVVQERHRRGIRCAFFCVQRATVTPRDAHAWRIVIDGERDQAEVVALRRRLRKPQQLAKDIDTSVTAGSDKLARIMAAADGFQSTAEEHVSAHHYANVLFNVLRGGIFDDGCSVSSNDFRKTIAQFNARVAERNRELLANLPRRLRYRELLEATGNSGDAQLQRLALEYLPITFGRRHGDPSRPWNQFAIVLKNEQGEDLLSYQGNWRDIFQNWEALALSYPTFVESMIAKFVNASTADGYNPYRITKEGIDWEVEEPDNPWSYIGYWGDHQIIYLLKLLELSRGFHPDTLHQMLRRPLFSYANVPYHIKPFELLVEDPKKTVVYDEDLARTIEARMASLGADGKLLLDGNGDVRQVNLLEKLLVPLLAKLGNLVVDGGIWLNTQRPEWNDANNALVGHGLSMVTLYYMRRYLHFLQELLGADEDDFAVSAPVVEWHRGTAKALRRLREAVDKNAIDDLARRTSLSALGRAASAYRETLYSHGDLDAPIDLPVEEIRNMLADALAITDRSIASNKRKDGLYHAYNIADFNGERLGVDHLYPMLEGQVAALSSGAVPAAEAVDVLEALYESVIYRADQDSFMLYPDRELPGFLERNRVPEERVASISLLRDMLHTDDTRIVLRDADGEIRFNADFRNAGDVRAMLREVSTELGDKVAADRREILDLYEAVFNHKAFTGRSGTMFGYEGLGSIYWHMVSKLLLAIAENFLAALDGDAEEATIQRLGELYYRVRKGIGFNKTPLEYGAFPVDPYSHTPKHAGARQPGMTGQVKEEILTRFMELGIRVRNGEISIEPALLRRREFADAARNFTFLDVDKNWQTLELPGKTLAFTWCQVPFVYRLEQDAVPGLDIEFDDGTTSHLDLAGMPAELCAELFERTGRIRKVTISVVAETLFGD